MDDLRANLPRMVVFAKVVDEGSFAAAAKALGLGRPAVSATIAALEASLGVTLLHRTTRSLRPTEVGEAFLEQCRQMASQARDALAEASAASERPVGTLRVTSPGGMIGERVVAPALARLVREHGVVVDLRCADRRLGLVESGFDACIRIGKPTESGLTMRRLGRTEEILVASPDLARTIERPEDLAEIGWVSHAELPRSFTLFGPGRRRLKVDMRPVAVVDDSAAMLGLLRGGAGVGLAVRVGLVDELAAGRLVQLFPERHAHRADIFVLLPSRRVPKRVRLLIDVLGEELTRTRTAQGMVMTDSQ